RDVRGFGGFFKKSKTGVVPANQLMTEKKRRSDPSPSVAPAVDRLPRRGQIARRQRAPDRGLILVQIRRQNPRGGLRSVGEFRIAYQVVSQHGAVILIVLSACQLDESSALKFH